MTRTIPQSLDPGAARRVEEAAKARRAQYQVTPEIAAARAELLEQREALREQAVAEAKAKVQASPDALRAVLGRGTVDELAQIARMIGRLDGRSMQAIVDEVFRERSSTGYRPDDEAPAPVASARDLAEIAIGAGGSAQASSGRRKR